LTEAAKRGHLGAFLDMAKATNTARMEDGDARDLLLALTTRGTSALGVAVIQRRSGAFIAFAQALVERGIVDGPALQMLDHRGVLRMTPIEMAPRVGYPDAKAEYARAKQLVEAGPAQP